MTSTSEVRAALRARYCAPEWAVMFEVGQGTGAAGGRYADAVSMNLYPSRGLELHGFEIKVSRGDWQRELKNPAKAESIYKFCERWWIVAPKGMVQKTELPPTWGLQELDNGKLRIVVQAPLNTAVPLPRSFIAALLRRSSEIDEKEVKAMVDSQVSAMRERDKANIEREITSRTRTATEKLAKIAEIEKIAGMSFTDWNVTPEVGALIRAINKSGVTGKFNSLSSLADNLRRHAEGIEREIASFEEVLKA